MSWWSNKFNRPLKDPILLSYTTEELAYEYYLHSEREKYEAELVQQESDKIEDDKIKEAESWADRMEREEEEALAAVAAKNAKNPSESPENIEWMKQEIERNKIELGEDFGEDINMNFEDL